MSNEKIQTSVSNAGRGIFRARCAVSRIKDMQMLPPLTCAGLTNSIYRLFTADIYNLNFELFRAVFREKCARRAVQKFSAARSLVLFYASCSFSVCVMKENSRGLYYGLGFIAQDALKLYIKLRSMRKNNGCRVWWWWTFCMPLSLNEKLYLAK